MKLRPQNPTPGDSFLPQAQKEPITNAEIIDALVAVLAAVKSVAPEGLLSSNRQINNAWWKINSLKERL